MPNKNEGSGWLFEGYAKINNEGSNKFHKVDTRLNGMHMITEFRYLKLYDDWNPYYYCDLNVHVEASKWLGGLIQGSNWAATLDGACNMVPNADRTRVGSGGSFEKDKNQGQHYGAVVSAWGVSLGGSSGMSQYVSYHYAFHRRNFICGANGHSPVTDDPSVAVGPNW